MDTWAEERREVLESVLDALRRADRCEGRAERSEGRTEQSEESSAACKYLLRHLLGTAWQPWPHFRYHVPEDLDRERCRHTHTFS